MAPAPSRPPAESRTLPELAEDIAEQARQLTAEALPPLDTVAVALGVGRLAESVLHAAVARARGAGHTWQEVSDVLGTSRQAAFQRFGKPVDPRTGAPMARSPLPGAANRATAVLALWLSGRWEEAVAAAAPLDERLAERLAPGDLADALARVVATVGAYQGMGAPLAHRRAEGTVVDVPLEFEAGEMTGRVALDARGRVTGLHILRPDAR